jgi:malate dehydrogenase (oxaloacetate-decarboxylating)
MSNNYNEKALDLHASRKGKIEIKTKVDITSPEDLAIAYTPGVGAVSRAVAADPEKVNILTNRANQVAIVSDGTAVLGLGDIGPEAALPVMEGKSVIFKSFAGVDAFPLCIRDKGVDEIVDICLSIQPTFAGINLEDISAPRCFEILDRLEKELDIPVFHDDQDGTAIVTLAALINALKVVGKKKENIKVVINGAGAAGIATARLFHTFGVGEILLLDSKCLITPARKDINPFKREISELICKNKEDADLKGSLVGADVFVGLSCGGLLDGNMVASMNERPIIFAMANPDPEITPDEAIQAGAEVVGTGRSDFPNQINNALIFPGIFRGLLDSGKKKVTEEMKIGAAQAVAAVVKGPSPEYIIPSINDKGTTKAIVDVIMSMD